MQKLSVSFKAPLITGLEESPIPEPAPNEVLVATRLSAISAGTEMLVFKGLFPPDLAVDATLDALPGRFHYPLTYGYSCVGVVTVAGDNVDRDWVGRSVFAFHPHESHFTASPNELLPLPQGMDLEDAVFLAAMETAVTLVLDGRPLIGERVLVWGLGIIGLLSTALLARCPLSVLAGVDRLALRCETALDLGADVACDGSDPDRYKALAAALTACPGDGKADLIFEMSGNPQAINEVLTWAGFNTRIIIGSWYGTRSAAMDLGGSFHRDRITIASSQVSTIAPHLTGRWSSARRLRTAWRMVQAVKPATLISHRFDIRKAQLAYEMLAEQPRTALQAVLVYPTP